jgi:hypothetical protein
MFDMMMNSCGVCKRFVWVLCGCAGVSGGYRLPAPLWAAQFPLLTPHYPNCVPCKTSNEINTLGEQAPDDMSALTDKSSGVVKKCQ